jgi:hypothetical protein
MDTFIEFLLYLFYGMGAFLCWAAKGFKTKFKEELSDDNKIRNASIAVILFIIVVALVIYVVNYM